ncbi:MAG TPA: copper amine oxidase [Clostridia bacterium]|jgi:exopolysaccharide biosynthesis protein|nr:copper amine oxidase [Clostridia bacterium]
MAKFKRKIWAGITTFCLFFSLGQAAWAKETGVKPTVEIISRQELEPGVVYAQASGKNVSGQPLVINILEADLSRSDVEVRPVLASGGVTSREKLSSISSRTYAVGAINGSFFSTASPYLPVGNLVVDGKVESASDMLRTSMGIIQNGTAKTVKFGYFNPIIHIKKGNSLQAIMVDKLNRPITGAETIVYTSEWKQAVNPRTNYTLVTVVSNSQGKQVVESIGGTNLTVPKNGYILHLPLDFANFLAVGDEIGVNISFDSYWQNVKHLLTGGPLLVEEGQPVFQAVAEGFTGSVLNANPRTAIGITQNGKMLLVTIDGRSATSGGVTFEELAYIMADLGAYAAMGLDGGGSTEMIVQGKIVNQLSGGSERSLNNGIVIVTGIPVYLNGERLYFDVPPQLINGRTLVPFRKLLEALGAQVDYDPESQVITATKEDKMIQFKAGDTKAFINNEEYILDVPAKVLNGRTLVPLRFAGAALGGNVDWTANKTVVITTE